jgi:hypothetical protein
VTQAKRAVRRESEASGGDEQRYERKFAPDFSSARQLDTQVRTHPSLFRTLYPDRWVNNVYLDTLDLACYRDNVDGNALRAKYRIRWYGDLLQAAARPVLEIKRKVGLVGSKLRFPLVSPFDTRAGLGEAALRSLLGGSEVPDFASEHLARMRVVLVNRYLRSYLLSADGHYRVTIDRELSFQSLPITAGCRGRRVQDPHLILELKYDRALEAGVSAVTSAFPFRVTRISKYVRGVEQLGAHGLRF